jgi:hypothetical protein
MILADWFARLGRDAGLPLHQYGSSGNSSTFGSPNEFNVTAKFTDRHPFLEFHASEQARQALVEDLARQATVRVSNGEFGGVVWHSAPLASVGFQLTSPFSMGPFLQLLGAQTRIDGWRRLGRDVLLEFKENPPIDPDKSNDLLAPNVTISVYVAVPGPCAGHFSSHIAHAVAETVAAICTFALGRSVNLPPTAFPAKAELLPDLGEKQYDPAILTLARKHIGLDIFSVLAATGGFDYFSRLRAAFLTFDAAVQQQRDAVACILYVVAAEALSMPSAPWRKNRLTKRFIEFFDDLMPSALDQMVSHGNFEAVFGIQRGARTARALRREMLEQIYDFRSGHLHAGLRPSYRGFTSGFETSDNIRRGLFADFAEGAILRYISSPRSSLVGHPNRNPDTPQPQVW